jgi:hypothetical protein
MVNTRLIGDSNASRVGHGQCLGSRNDSFWHETADNRVRPLGKSRSHCRSSFVHRVFVPRVDAIARSTPLGCRATDGAAFSDGAP